MLFRACHLVNHGKLGQLQLFGVGRAKIDYEPGVREYVAGVKTVCGAILAEAHGDAVAQFRGLPSGRIHQVERESPGPEPRCI